MDYRKEDRSEWTPTGGLRDHDIRRVTGDSTYLLVDKFEVQNYCDMPLLEIHPNSIASNKKQRSISARKCSYPC